MSQNCSTLSGMHLIIDGAALLQLALDKSGCFDRRQVPLLASKSSQHCLISARSSCNEGLHRVPKAS